MSDALPTNIERHHKGLQFRSARPSFKEWIERCDIMVSYHKHCKLEDFETDYDWRAAYNAHKNPNVAVHEAIGDWEDRWARR